MNEKTAGLSPATLAYQAVFYQLRQAVALAPAFADAHYNLGLALAKRGEFAAAIDNYSKVLSLRPSYPKVHYFLAFALALMVVRTRRSITTRKHQLNHRTNTHSAAMN
jgi:lipoprotein NlpI